jgi:hypothetical protein
MAGFTQYFAAQENNDILHKMVKALIQRETIGLQQIGDLIAGRQIKLSKNAYSSAPPREPTAAGPKSGGPF